MIHAFELLINKFLIKNQNYNQMYEKLKKLAVLLIECKSNNEIYLKIYSNYRNNQVFKIHQLPTMICKKLTILSQVS